MSESAGMQHGTLSISREIKCPRERVFEAWTRLEHRQHWFAGPAWTAIARSLDLRVGGCEVAHGRFENGVETVYTSRFHLIEAPARLVYVFDMQVAGAPFSVSLAGLEFEVEHGWTRLTYTEQAFFLAGDYGRDARLNGTNGLLDRFEAYVSTLSR